MKNRTVASKQKVINIFLNLLTIGLILFIFIAVGTLIDNYKYEMRVPFPASTLSNQLNYGSFNSIAYYAHTDYSSGFASDPSLKPYYAIMDYYDAAVLYKAYEKDGNREMADKYAAIMEQKQSGFGSLSAAKEGIRQELRFE